MVQLEGLARNRTLVEGGAGGGEGAGGVGQNPVHLLGHPGVGLSCRILECFNTYLAYTPGQPSKAHPRPQLTTPIWGGWQNQLRFNPDIGGFQCELLCSHQSLAAVLGGNEWTARISLARVLSRVSGADHVGSDAAIGLVAHGIGGHSDVDLLQGGGLVASAAEGAPTSDGGKDTSVSGTQVSWKTCRAHFVGECDRRRQTKDGVVVVSSL